MVLFDRQLLDWVEQIHMLYEIRNFESVYRSPSYNASVGGAKMSRHCEGKAIDISLVDSGKLLLAAKYAVSLGVPGVELDLSNKHLHLDMGPRIWHVMCNGKGSKRKETPLEQVLTWPPESANI